MAAPVLHSDQVGINILVGENIRLAGQVGLLTDQNVIDATTWESLKNSIDTNSAATHSDVRGYVDRLKAAIDLGKNDGTLTDANIQAATGINNLASLTLGIGIGPILE